ncbi:MAG TPA: chromate efflux transporter, partial [Dongiaceae bacterium]|nr:chromate efflux transporter [Dongiaceae bacterium]
ALLHGLQLVAVAIVAQAVWGMARAHCTDLVRRAIAVASAAILIAIGAPMAQLGVLALGAVSGALLLRGEVGAVEGGDVSAVVSRRTGLVAQALFVLLLAGLPLLQRMSGSHGIALADAFYRSGALVFGGGHVVLPLLREAFVTPGWVSDGVFLAGYGAAQAVPGPLFSFAAYLGAVVDAPPNGVAGAVVGLVGIFLPGLLLLVGALPFWEILRRRSGARAVMAGVNAAVVGLLAAALYRPVWTSSVHLPVDLALVVLGFALLMVWRAPPLFVVVVTALGAVGVKLLGLG